MASSDYTTRFSSREVVSDWEKDHEVLEERNKEFSPVSFP